MQSLHPLSALRAGALPARAELPGPDRFGAAPAPAVGELRSALQPARGHRLEVGAALRRPGTEAAPDPFGQGWQLGAWAEDRWQLTQGLVASGGVRFGRDDAGLRSQTPHAGLSWHGPLGLRLQAGVERDRRAAALAFDRRWPGGLRVQAGLGLQRAAGASTGTLSFDLRLESPRWWLGFGRPGGAAAAEPLHLRLGAHLVF